MEARRGGPPLRSESSLRQAPRGEGLEGCATRCLGPDLAEAADSPRGPREEVAAKEERFPSAATAFAPAAPGFARRRDQPRPPFPGQNESKGERGAHARRLPPPPGLASSPRPHRLAALTLAAGRSLGASTRVASLPARARLECGVVIVTLRSGGASQRSCSGCSSRCPRLGRAGCRPGGALTSPPCSAPVPPTPPFTLPLSVEPTCCSKKAHARQDAQIPPCRPLLRASALPSPPPGSAVCVPQLRPGELRLQVQGWGGGEGTRRGRRAGGGMKQAMTFPFPAGLLRATSVVSDSRSPPPPNPRQ